MRFNPPPGWDVPGDGWSPPHGWTPDPAWPAAPEGWQFWIRDTATAAAAPAEDDADRDEERDGEHREEEHDDEERDGEEEEVAGADEHEDAQAGQHDDEVVRLRAQVAELEAELAARAASGSETGGLIELSDERILQDVGIYRYHHPLENAAAYKDRLAELMDQIKACVANGDAILASETFTYNNSLAKGRKMTADLSKLMLRAYNAEADNCVRSLRAGNIVTAKKRLQAAVDSIAKLGAMMEMRVSPAFHQLRVDEIELTADYLMKVQEEKEAAREEREQLREQRKVEQELAREREKLDKELAHYQNALAAVTGNGDPAAAAELAAKVAELEQAIEQNDYRAANIRAGYVYVISNVGAFGRGVVKIGMTRRLEPMDRVRELGDASVPFPYDVHALYFSDDAITLEASLHKTFAERRVNMVNERREFFFATPEEVRVELAKEVGNLLEYTDTPEATQYQQSRKYWPTGTDSAG